MKAVFSLAAFFANTILAATIPDENGWYLRRADEMHLEDLPIVDLQITDERFGDRVFNGTVEAVYAQMKAEKPELFMDEKPFDMETLSRSPSLSKRQGTVNCGWPSNNVGDRVGTWYNCLEGMTYLMKLGQAICGVPASPACSRVSCSHSCGMFLCNKLNREYKMHCDSIPADMNAIATECQDSVGRVWGARDWPTHYLGLRRQSC